MNMKERNPHNRASKADQVTNKVSGASGSSAPSNARVRPNSKADEIGKKIPSSQPSQPAQASQPSKPAAPQSQPRDYPSNPQPQPSQPSGNNSCGCCLLPFTLAVLSIIGSLVIIF